MPSLAARAVVLTAVVVAVWMLSSRSRSEKGNVLDTVDSIGGAGSAQQLVFDSSREDGKTIARRVAAVADLHGDLEHAHNVLRMAKLVDQGKAEPSWIGGHDVLVSTGDIVDRGDDTIPLYRMYQRLRDQSRAQGGDVHNCIGNHEMMNALMDWRYVTQGDLASFGSRDDRRHAMSAQGWIGQEWLANYSMSHTVPLLPLNQLPARLLQSGKYTPPHANFVHGGIHPAWSAKGLSEINRVGHSLLRKALSEAKPSGWLPADATEEEKHFYGEHGPLWYRGYALDDEAQVCNEASEALRDLGAERLVMGHTPHFSGFVVRCKGQVLLIDTGISRAYGGEQSALIIDTELRPANAAQASQWIETSTITALYRGRTPKVLQTTQRTIDI